MTAKISSCCRLPFVKKQERKKNFSFFFNFQGKLYISFALVLSFCAMKCVTFSRDYLTLYTVYTEQNKRCFLVVCDRQLSKWKSRARRSATLLRESNTLFWDFAPRGNISILSTNAKFTSPKYYIPYVT